MIIVGYGANPQECVNLIRELGCLTVTGNHDHAVIGCQDMTYFNQHAHDAVMWTRAHLDDDARVWLKGLPFIEHLEKFSIVHGSLQSPELFNYVQTIKDAEFNFRLMDNMVLFLGHSHYPLAFFNTEPMTYTLDPKIMIDPEVKSIVNVGSVGQPRDENSMSAFAVYDDEAGEVVVHRVAYDIEKAAGKILEAGLPQALALRLSLGK